MSTKDSENEFKPTGYQDDYNDQQDSDFEDSHIEDDHVEDDNLDNEHPENTDGFQASDDLIDTNEEDVDDDVSKNNKSNKKNGNGGNGNSGKNKDGNQSGKNGKSSNLPLIIFGVIGLILILSVGYLFLGGSKTHHQSVKTSAKSVKSVPSPASSASSKSKAIDVKHIANTDKKSNKRAKNDTNAVKSLNNPFGNNENTPINDGKVNNEDEDNHEISTLSEQSPDQNDIGVSNNINPLETNDNSEEPNQGISQNEVNEGSTLSINTPSTEVPKVESTVSSSNSFFSGLDNDKNDDSQNNTIGDLISGDASNSSNSDNVISHDSNDFSSLLKPIQTHVNEIDDKVNSLTNDVDAMKKTLNELKRKVNSRASSHRAIPKSHKTKKHTKRVEHKNIVSVKPYVKNHDKHVSSSSDNQLVKDSVVWQIAPVSHIVLGKGSYSNHNGANVNNHVEIKNDVTTHASSSTKMKNCPSTIQAIVRGRVWFKNSSGTFKSFGVGDQWVSGKTIEAIDPEKGIKVNNKWFCHK